MSSSSLSSSLPITGLPCLPMSAYFPTGLLACPCLPCCTSRSSHISALICWPCSPCCMSRLIHISRHFLLGHTFALLHISASHVSALTRWPCSCHAAFSALSTSLSQLTVDGDRFRATCSSISTVRSTPSRIIPSIKYVRVQFEACNLSEIPLFVLQ